MLLIISCQKYHFILFYHTLILFRRCLLQSRPDLRLVLLEKESTLAKHQTGNNSGVIHSGLYYRPGSLKALNCIAGYRQLLTFCQDEEIPHEICGKVVVATSEKELPN
ncbi:FAD-dependent oxidoreductase [Cylindrospermopsis raciborskii GIHE 2018]|nr:FAD-dependent oxidoreductase [Cylindrospermopsis raciborskii GIHE 2018]